MESVGVAGVHVLLLRPGKRVWSQASLAGHPHAHSTPPERIVAPLLLASAKVTPASILACTRHALAAQGGRVALGAGASPVVTCLGSLTTCCPLPGPPLHIPSRTTRRLEASHWAQGRYLRLWASSPHASYNMLPLAPHPTTHNLS